MSDERSVVVTLPADVHQIDQTGLVWAFLDEAGEPDRVQPGAVIVAGDPEEPFLARVVDIVDGPGGRPVVHLDVVGVADQVVDELAHAQLVRATPETKRLVAVPHGVAGVDEVQASRRRFDSWIMRRRWAGRHPFWSSLLYGTVNMYLVVPFLVAFDPSYDNNRGDVIWSLAIAYVLWPTLVIWNLWRWQPGGRFHEAWLREHGIRPKAVRWPRRRRPAAVIPR